MQPQAHASEDKSDTRAGAMRLPGVGGSVQKERGDFASSAFTGSASFSLPLHLPQGPGETPALGIQYQTRAGNGPLGVGWSLGGAAIERDTTFGIPSYQRDSQGRFTDSFVFGGTRLIPAGQADGRYAYRLEKDGGYTSVSYTDRSLSVGGISFAGGWVVRTSGGETLYFVNDPCSVVQPVVAAPGGESCETQPLSPKIARWLLRFSRDAAGNLTEYRYHLVHRQLVLRSVSYGPNNVEFVAFDKPRLDLAVSNRYGFATRQSALIAEAKVYRKAALYSRYCFVYRQPMSAGSALLYSPDCKPKDSVSLYAPGARLLNTVTFLERVLSFGQPGRYGQAAEHFPEVAFGYSPWFSGDVTGTRRQAIFEVRDFKQALWTGRGYGNELLDLNHDGLPDIVNIGTDQMKYVLNAGQMVGQAVGSGRLEPLRGLPFTPRLREHNHQLADMDGDGLADYVIIEGARLRYFSGQKGMAAKPGGFARQEVTVMLGRPWTDRLFRDGKARLVDLNADGYADLLTVQGRSGVTVSFNQGGSGFGPATVKPATSGHSRYLSEGYLHHQNATELRDLNGDGLIDVLQVGQSGVRVFYNTGTGDEANVPLFDILDGQREDVAGGHYLAVRGTVRADKAWFLDANGDGLEDFVYVNPNNTRQVQVHLNLGQGDFGADPSYTLQIASGRLAGADGLFLRVADVDGDGQKEVVFKSGSEVLMLDLNRTGASDQLIKSGLLTRVRYETGKQIDLQYALSTDEYERDKAQSSSLLGAGAGRQPLPFPVVVVKRIVVTQGEKAPAVSAKTQEFLYHNGYYDAARRQFAGFGEVTTIEYGDASQGGILTRQRFHSGADDDGGFGKQGLVKEMATYELSDPIYQQTEVATEQFVDSAFVHSLSHYAVQQTEPKLSAFPLSRSEHQYQVMTRAGGELYVCPSWQQELRYSDDGQAFAGKLVETACDEWGNVAERQVTGLSSEGGQGVLVKRELYSYEQVAQELSQQHIFDRPSLQTVTDGQGRRLKQSKHLYYANGLEKTRQQWIEADRYAPLSYEYTAQGRVKQITDAKGHVTRYGYDPAGVDLLWERNALGHEQQAFYDCSGGIDDEFGQQKMACAVSGEMVKHIDANGVITLLQWDALGRLVRRVSSAKDDIRYRYVVGRDGEWNRTEVQTRTDASGQVFHQAYFYNSLGEKVAQVTEAAGQNSRVQSYTQYNRRGLAHRVYVPYWGGASVSQLVSQGLLPQPKGKSFVKTYDALGRLVSSRYPTDTAQGAIGSGDKGLVSREFYGYQPQQVTKTVVYTSQYGLSGQHLRSVQTTETLDALGQVVGWTNALGATTRYGRDVLGRLTWLKDAKGHTRRVELERSGPEGPADQPERRQLELYLRPDRTAGGGGDCRSG